MNDFTPFQRTVVFVDGYSSREVLLDAEERVSVAVEPVFSTPVELLHAAALNIGDKEMAQFAVTHQSCL